jgi:hypothetical protein
VIGCAEERANDPNADPMGHVRADRLVRAVASQPQSGPIRRRLPNARHPRRRARPRTRRGRRDRAGVIERRGYAPSGSQSGPSIAVVTTGYSADRILRGKVWRRPLTTTYNDVRPSRIRHVRNLESGDTGRGNVVVQTGTPICRLPVREPALHARTHATDSGVLDAVSWPNDRQGFQQRVESALAAVGVTFTNTGRSSS